MGDFHYGHEDFSSSVLHGYLNYLKDHPNIMIGLNGDIIEYGQGSSYVADDERMPIDDQISAFVSDFKPLAKRIKFLLWGNHELRFTKRSKSKRLMEDIARELGLEPRINVYVGKPQRGVFVIFKAGDKRYGAVIKHSKTAARVNQDLQLKRSGSQNVASLIIHGHTHRLSFQPRTFRALEIMDGLPKNVVRRQFLVATGCFLKQPGYAEAGDYPYTDVGAPILRFFSDEHNIQEYDLTGCYKNYLARGGVSYSHANVKLSKSYGLRCKNCNSDNIINWSANRKMCNSCGRSFKV